MFRKPVMTRMAAGRDTSIFHTLGGGLCVESVAGAAFSLCFWLGWKPAPNALTQITARCLSSHEECMTQDFSQQDLHRLIALAFSYEELVFLESVAAFQSASEEIANLDDFDRLCQMGERLLLKREQGWMNTLFERVE
jgi:hypothetical protein